MSFVERLASVQEDDEMHVATQGSRARVDRSIASLVGPGALPYGRSSSTTIGVVLTLTFSARNPS